jgi:hypothetical protein
MPAPLVVPPVLFMPPLLVVPPELVWPVPPLPDEESSSLVVVLLQAGTSEMALALSAISREW